jgi:thiopeptide-type bacteriocin biosynthesis protein
VDVSDSRDIGWHYLKLYLRPEEQARLLADHGWKLWCRATIGNRDCFFVRYFDVDHQSVSGGHHLRLRYHGSRDEAADLARELALAASRITPRRARIQRARYDPETDRYGGDHGLEITHEVFTVDSGIVLQLAAKHEHRPEIALASAHDQLRCIASTPALRGEAYRCQVDWVLGQLCRSAAERAHILDAAQDRLDRLAPRLAAARQLVESDTEHCALRTALVELGKELTVADRSGRLSRPLAAILADYQHMHFNRSGVSPRREISALLLLAAANRGGVLP